jgi:dynein heavy chain 2
VVTKANALKSWLSRQQQKSLMNSGLVLSDLFHPETLLNAMRQAAARKLKTAIDDLKLVSSFDSSKVGGGA